MKHAVALHIVGGFGEAGGEFAFDEAWCVARGFAFIFSFLGALPAGGRVAALAKGGGLVKAAVAKSAEAVAAIAGGHGGDFDMGFGQFIDEARWQAGLP